MTLTIKKFSDDTLTDTHDSWISTADGLGIPGIDYLTILAWAKNHTNYSADGDSLAYGIFEDGTDGALAIVDIIYSPRPGPDVGWLKMLRVSLGPTFAPSEIDKNPDKMAQIIDIYAEATIGTIGLTGDHKSRVIKLYGRNDSLLALLNALNERLKVVLAGKCHTKMEGRWLIISAH